MVTIHHQPGSNIIALVIDGKVDKDDYKLIIEASERITERHEKVRFLLEVRNLGSVEPGALWQELRYDAEHLGDVEKAAVVSDKSWYTGLAKMLEPFTSIKVEHFDLGERAAAEAWLQS